MWTYDWGKERLSWRWWNWDGAWEAYNFSFRHRNVEFLDTQSVRALQKRICNILATFQINWKRKKIEWFWPSFKEQELWFSQIFQVSKANFILNCNETSRVWNSLQRRIWKKPKLQCISSWLTGFVVKETETFCFDFLKLILCYSKKANTKSQKEKSRQRTV